MDQRLISKHFISTLFPLNGTGKKGHETHFVIFFFVVDSDFQLATSNRDTCWLLSTMLAKPLFRLLDFGVVEEVFTWIELRSLLMRKMLLNYIIVSNPLLASLCMQQLARLIMTIGLQINGCIPWKTSLTRGNNFHKIDLFRNSGYGNFKGLSWFRHSLLFSFPLLAGRVVLSWKTTVFF